MNWIIFDGETEPVRLDQLSEEQEIWLENGKPYRHYERHAMDEEPGPQNPIDEKEPVSVWWVAAV